MALLALAYGRFFEGTYFSQDDYVWLCFCKWYAEPITIFWRDTLGGQFFRPLGQCWWLLIYSLFGDRLAAYQVGFLGIHLVNSLLAAGLARMVAGRGISAFAVFLLFALNPLYIAPISNYFHYDFDTFGFTFYLAALVLLRGSIVRRSTWLVAGSLAAALLAYFAKEAFFTLPAAIGLVLGIEAPGETWRGSTLRARLGLLWSHVAVWTAAAAWRLWIVGSVGGYALVSIDTPADAIRHVVERVETFVGLAGWSIVPHLARWQGNEGLPLAASVVLLAALTWWGSKAMVKPGPLWLWGWMVLTWLPSAVMTSYAPVSWYACSFGSTLLIGSSFARTRFRDALALAIGLYYAIYGFGYYTDRIGFMAELREQHQVLTAEFPQGGHSVRQGTRFVLLRCNPNLFPDAIVKYGSPPDKPIADVLFFADQVPVNWAVTGEHGPGSIAPVTVSSGLQAGYMDMDPLRVYPLVLPANRLEIVRAGEPFRFLLWQDGRLIDITDLNPYREQPRAEDQD